MLQFNGSMQKLTSSLLPSPFGTEPSEPLKYEIRSKKINGIAVHCLEFHGKEVGTCFNAEDGTPFSYRTNLAIAYYSNYVEFEGKWFPSSIKLRENGDTVLEAKLEIKPWSVDATVWRVPVGVLASELPKCADAKAPVASVKAINQQRPQSLAISSNSRQQGTVVFYATIGTDGGIKNLVLLQSASTMLDQAAYEAVKNWTYEPILRCGVPIEVELPITVNFHSTP
jgi:TonB family protein